MARKHNVKHNRTQSAYKRKVQEGGVSHQSDPVLHDGKRASASR